MRKKKHYYKKKSDTGTEPISGLDYCEQCFYITPQCKCDLTFSKSKQVENNSLSIRDHKKIFSKKRNKFSAVKKSYNGRTYHSALEADYAMQLDLRKKAGEIKEIIPQYKISIDINGVHITNYFMDFKVILPGEEIEMHEVKGFETDLWRIKWRLARALNPQWKFVLIK